MDDNGNKILLAKFVDQRNEPTEPDVFQFERTVDGKEAVLTEREKDRLRRYLAEAFGGEETIPRVASHHSQEKGSPKGSVLKRKLNLADNTIDGADDLALLAIAVCTRTYRQIEPRRSG